MNVEQLFQVRGAYSVVKLINESPVNYHPLSVERSAAGAWYLGDPEHCYALPIDMPYLVRAHEPALSFFITLLVTIAHCRLHRLL